MIPPAAIDRVHYWRPASIPDLHMLRLERCADASTTYSERYSIVAVREGAFDGWYRGVVHTYAAGQLKLVEPGEVHRGVHVHAPFSIHVASFAPEAIAEVAAVLGRRGPVHFRSATLGAKAHATARAFAMHAALARRDATPLELGTLVAEALAAVVSEAAEPGAARFEGRAPRAVQRARAFLLDTLAEKVTLGAVAAHAGLDKFHLVRAFRAEVGLPPYEYLTHVRVARASTLLARGASPAEAAHAVGLYDESQLHRHFRRIVGTTPGRFARSLCDPRRRSGQHRPSRAGAAAAHSRQ